MVNIINAFRHSSFLNGLTKKVFDTNNIVTVDLKMACIQFDISVSSVTGYHLPHQKRWRYPTLKT